MRCGLKLEQDILVINWIQAAAKRHSCLLLALCPGSLWRPGAQGWQGVGAQQCPNLSPTVLQSVQHLGSSWQCNPSSAWWCLAPTEPVWRHAWLRAVWLWVTQSFCSVISRGLEGVEQFLLTEHYFLKFCLFSTDRLRRGSLWGRPP